MGIYIFSTLQSWGLERPDDVDGRRQEYYYLSSPTATNAVWENGTASSHSRRWSFRCPYPFGVGSRIPHSMSARSVQTDTIHTLSLLTLCDEKAPPRVFPTRTRFSPLRPAPTSPPPPRLLTSPTSPCRSLTQTASISLRKSLPETKTRQHDKEIHLPSPRRICHQKPSALPFSQLLTARRKLCRSSPWNNSVHRAEMPAV